MQRQQEAELPLGGPREKVFVVIINSHAQCAVCAQLIGGGWGCGSGPKKWSQKKATPSKTDQAYLICPGRNGLPNLIGARASPNSFCMSSHCGLYKSASV